jgi:hypothetical protein
MPSYLTAGKIKDGMSGTISGEPREEKHDFQDGKGEKLLFRISVHLDNDLMDDYAGDMARDWIWSPGVYARSFLEEQLGEEYQSWINTHGSFHPKAWKSKNKSGFAWHFIPDDQTKLNIPPPTIPETVNSKTDTVYSCRYCDEEGDAWQTTKENKLLEHVKRFHSEKLPKDGTEPKVKTRVKKE